MYFEIAFVFTQFHVYFMNCTCSIFLLIWASNFDRILKLAYLKQTYFLCTLWVFLGLQSCLTAYYKKIFQDFARYYLMSNVCTCFIEIYRLLVSRKSFTKAKKQILQNGCLLSWIILWKFHSFDEKGGACKEEFSLR